MQPLSKQEHRDALVRRRIRFILKYPAIARLFKKGSQDELETRLLEKLNPARLAKLRSRTDYERWLERTVEDPCWHACSRWSCDAVRWAHVAKVVNIIVYELLANRELTEEADWHRLRPWLHVPIDLIVGRHLHEMDAKLKLRRVLKGMSKEEYRYLQTAIRRIADQYQLPPIWFEAVWSEDRRHVRRENGQWQTTRQKDVPDMRDTMTDTAERL
jgi:hypothetical protein